VATGAGLALAMSTEESGVSQLEQYCRVEGDYYFHAVCYSAYKNGESRPTPKGALPDDEGEA
jgi:hypothetical protein